MRDIQLKAQYFVLFKNPRDVEQMNSLQRQTGLKLLSEAYEKVTVKAYNPLLIDMKPDTPRYSRIRSGF